MELDFFTARRKEFERAVAATRNSGENVVSIALQYFGLGRWVVVGITGYNMDVLDRLGLDKGIWVFTANYGHPAQIAKRLDQELRIAIIGEKHG